MFCGDSLFYIDIGTARADFPGGSASSLYNSGRKLLQFPGHFKIWLGHDYPSGERVDPVDCLSVRDHREHNKHFANDITEEDFVAMREARDATLAAPKLLHPSLQMNIRTGRLPGPTPVGHRLLHLPLEVDVAEW